MPYHPNQKQDEKSLHRQFTHQHFNLGLDDASHPRTGRGAPLSRCFTRQLLKCNRGDACSASRLTMGTPHLQVLEANLQVQLPGAGDDVFAGLLNGNLNHGVRLGQPLQALHQLRQVLRMLQVPGARTTSLCIYQLGWTPKNHHHLPRVALEEGKSLSAIQPPAFQQGTFKVLVSDQIYVKGYITTVSMSRAESFHSSGKHCRQV